ncbi:PAS domain-containing protein [Polyangium jinanense]|uniref:PAS domain-containing protein n=1 Tax=Polyangium jinanense TaxID=2829994 RepID=A0A9X3X1Q8_9BACT|nr:PAS domain-containing protein [Polyangium jinanense]MDC3954380.1 PAS domain-containing protein [Polyangium jinanense]MDC3980683.1 PAS domain-containing protein [Polyangium jinanense]
MLKDTPSGSSSHFASGAWSALDALTDPVALVDARGGIRYANLAWYRLADDAEPGPRSRELATSTPPDAMLDIHETNREAMRAGIAEVIAGRRARFDLELGTCVAADEAERWFSLVVTPCPVDPEGGALVHLRDVTAQKKTESALRASEEGLLWAQEIGRMGNWDWDIPTGGLTWSDQIFRIFGYEPQKFDVSYQAFVNTIHPDDRDMVVVAVNKAVNERAPYSIEHRIVLPTGEVRVVHEQGKVFYSDSGAPLRMLGTVQDVTERKQSADIIRFQAVQLEQELAAREEAERARTALQDEVIRVQRALLEELSTPLIPIREDIMVLPLIGAIDARRADQMLETVLHAAVAKQTRVVIIDITGVRQVDTHVANTLMRTAQALGLVGAQVVLTGIRSDVARTLVELDVPLTSLVVRGTLASGIAYATGQAGKRR